MAHHLPYAGTIARQGDPDRFFLSVMYPENVHMPVWSLLAFQHEIAKTREVVTEPTLGLIRLQWWRDALDNIYAGQAMPPHEILQPLAQTIQKYKLPQAAFEQLLQAREFDLEGKAPADLPSLARYARDTSAPLTRLVLGVTDPDVEADGAAAISQAYALAGLMRALPFHVRDGRCYIPETLLHEYGLKNGADMFVPGNKDSSRAIVQSLHDQALECMSAGGRKAVWLAGTSSMTQQFLAHIRRKSFDITDSRYAMVPPFFHVRTYIDVLLKRAG